MAVLRRALEIVAQEPPPSPVNEPTLNRLLYFAILQAEREFSLRGEAPLAPVMPEARNAPAATDLEHAPRENKIPDFQWGLRDDSVPDTRDSAKHFVVEAKCLIAPRRGDWRYTEQYVIGGARRFVSEDHGYGKGVSQGAMVGYVRTLTFEQALAEVGDHLAEEGMAHLTTLVRDADDYLELSHELDRTFAESPFMLAHLWRRI